MKIISVWLLAFGFCFSLELGYSSLQCDFVQTVTNQKGKTVTYSGVLMAKKPEKALWIYKKPVQKEVYISIKDVVVYEPQLEQAIVHAKHSAFGLEEVLKNAKSLGGDRYGTVVDDMKITFVKKREFIENISYIDKLDNKVEISFLKFVKNPALEDKLFVFTPKPGIDILKK